MYTSGDIERKILFMASTYVLLRDSARERNKRMNKRVNRRESCVQKYLIVDSRVVMFPIQKCC